MSSPNSVRIIQILGGGESDVNSCDFGPNHELATGSGDKKVSLYTWIEGLGYVESESSPFVGHKYSVTCVRFSKSTISILASSSVDGTTNIWNYFNGELLQSLVQDLSRGVRDVSFADCGNLLASAGEGGTLCLWSVMSTSTLLRSLDGHDDESVEGVAFSPDSLLVATADVTGTFKVWSVADLKDERSHSSPVVTARGTHDSAVNSIEFSPESKSHMPAKGGSGLHERDYLVVTAGDDHTVAVWQLTTTQAKQGPITGRVELFKRLKGHNSSVSEARTSAKGDLIISSSIDKTLRIWQVSTGQCLSIISGHERYVTSCAFSPDQVLVASASNDRTVRVLDLTGSVTFDTTFSTGQRRGLSSSRKSNKIKLLHRLEYHRSSVNSVSFGHGYLASGGSDHKIVIYSFPASKDIGDWKVEHILDSAHRYPINQVCLAGGRASVPKYLASCSLDGTVIVTDINEGTTAKGFHVSGSGIRSVAVSEDMKKIAAGGDDDGVKVFDFETSQEIVSFTEDCMGVTTLSFSYDCVYLAVGNNDGHCRIYELDSETDSGPRTIENAHDLGVTSSDFSETCHSTAIGSAWELATCGVDALVKIWKLTKDSIEIVFILRGHGGCVTCVRFSPKLAEVIASTATDKTCRLWDSYSGECLHVVESTAVLTSCSFSIDASLIAAGSMDKSVIIWELPAELAFRSFLEHNNIVESWSVANVNNWLQSINLPQTNLNGATLLRSTNEEILTLIGVEEERRSEVESRLNHLKSNAKCEVPDEFLCPITHQMMRDPVTAADGYTYERFAIESWYGRGRKTSPMTNEEVDSETLTPDTKIQNEILAYLS